jgi:hypothetical protein
MKEDPYNPYTRAHGDQRIDKICPNCGNEHLFHRETGHQHWRRVRYLGCLHLNDFQK